MKTKIYTLRLVLISLSVFVSATNIFAENHPEEKVEKGTYNPVPKIMHHIQNSHEWHLFDYKDNEITINKSNLRNIFLNGKLEGKINFFPFFVKTIIIRIFLI